MVSFLGATSVSVKEQTVSQGKSKIGGDGNVDAVKVKVSSSGKYENNTTAKTSIDFTHKYKPNLNIEMAKKYIHEFSLENDEQLCNLVKVIEDGSMPTSRELKINTSKQMQALIEFAADIQPYANIAIKTKLENNTDITNSYELKIEVEFDCSRTG